MELKMRLWLSRSLRVVKSAGVQIATATVAGLLAGAAIGVTPHPISQKNREFQPKRIAIKRGEALRFINDDGELLHHAYLTSETFNFDSGDQKPGSTFDVLFPVIGRFTVLCAIHPKMKLVVNVD
jgi:plastocyanin